MSFENSFNNQNHSDPFSQPSSNQPIGSFPPNPYQAALPGVPANLPVNPIPVSPNPTIQPAQMKKKGIGFWHKLEILIIILILLSATFLAIILISPQSEFSQLIIKNTFLNQYISTQSNDDAKVNEDDTKDKLANTEETKEIKPQDILPFEFAKVVDAKTKTEVVEEVLPSVLSISVNQTVSTLVSNKGFIAGTGYIVNDSGMVVTNKHVISSQCQFGSIVEIIGTNQDNDVYTLKLLSIDPVYDIAILQIQNPPKTLKPISFANSDNVKLGSEVIAVGNALGELQNTVTSGIVSGLSRSVSTDLLDECTNSPVFADGLIQTDAAINHGNSGGPLFNASGQLIGMNTFGTEGAENIGLAIPSSVIVSALNSYRDYGVITRPKLGIYSQTITPLLKDQESWIPIDYGELILAPSGKIAIEQGSSADIAGLKEGDIILEINNETVKSSQNNPSPLRRTLLNFKPGDKITLTVLKNTGPNSNGFNYESKSSQVVVVLGKIVFELQD